MASSKTNLRKGEMLLLAVAIAITAFIVNAQNSNIKKNDQSSVPPSFDISTQKFLGNLDANSCLPLGVSYTQADVDSFTELSLDPNDRSSIKAGISLYHTTVNYTANVSEIFGYITPNISNRVFLVYYSNGSDSLAEGFHVYPPLPADSVGDQSTTAVHNITDPGTFGIPPHTGFAMYSCKDVGTWKLNSENKPADALTDLTKVGDGWTLIPLKEEQPYSGQFADVADIVASVGAQESDGFNFPVLNMTTTLADLALDDNHYMVWVYLDSSLAPVLPEGAADEVDGEGLEDLPDDPEDTNSQISPAPSCYGNAATIYVSADKIVGGSHDGENYLVTLIGSAGNDVMIGTSQSDTINGGNGNDVICGLGGDDTIYGEAGADLLYGEGGSDQLLGGASTDVIFGGPGNDEIFGGDSGDLIFGEQGDDNITGQKGNDRICGGGGGEDFLEGEDDDDRIDGGSGNMNLENGGDGYDTCNGGNYLNCEKTNLEIPECNSELTIYNNKSSATSIFNAMYAYLLKAAGPGDCLDQNTCQVNKDCTGPCEESAELGCYTCPQEEVAASMDPNPDPFGLDQNNNRAQSCPSNAPYLSELSCQKNCGFGNNCIEWKNSDCFYCDSNNPEDLLNKK